MKFNWGYKITAVYLVFIAGIMFLVVQSSRQTVDLVTPDYYSEELKYQEKIDQKNRAAGLSSPIRYDIRDKSVDIRFPPEFEGKEITGHVLLYYPADSKKDIKMEVNTRSGKTSVSIPGKRSGMHILQVSWVVDGQSYYFEEPLFMP